MIFRMADAYIAANLLENLENRIQRLERRTDRRVLREIEDPFDLTDNLIDILAPHLMHTKITGLSVEKQVNNDNSFST